MAARVESRFTVPAATTISVSSGALTAAVPVTWTSGNYYATSAGGVSSGPTVLTTAINAAVSPYPDNAASMASAVGWGTWSAGWSFQIASGNDTGMFGGVTLTASGSPSYSNAGPGNGGDLAIGIDATGTDYFGGGDVFDVGAASDLIIATVVRFPSGYSGLTNIVSKDTAGVDYWAIFVLSSTIYLRTYSTSTGLNYDTSVSISTLTAGEYFAVVATIDRSTGKARIAVKGLTSGVSAVSTETTIGPTATFSDASVLRVGTGALSVADPFYMSSLYIAAGAGVATGISANLSTALTNFASAVSSAFTVSVSTTDGRTTISNSFWSYSLTWTSTTARDLLGFAGNITSQTTETSTKQAKGIWFPGSPLSCDEHPSMYPDETDTRGSESPTGVVLGLSGNVKYVHTNVGFERCAVSQIREASATYTNGSLETFFRDAISGQGHAWFRPLSPLQFYWDNAGVSTLLGSDANSSTGVAGWSPVGISKFREIAVPSQRNWVGQFDVRFPRLVSSG